MADRQIDDVLHFRRDLSPFLTHLTKATDEKSAKQVLSEIISSKKLRQSEVEISDIRFQYPWTHEADYDAKKKALTCCICFTESPLDQLHCLLDIANRTVDLSGFGLVFLRDKLKTKHVCPCVYLNNWTDDFDSVIKSLATWGWSNHTEAQRLLPLISAYGNKLPNKNGAKGEGIQDFYWEREWRLPRCHGSLQIEASDLFCGLCDEENIDELEQHFKDCFGAALPFIDPYRPPTYYAKKLVDRRKNLGIDHSVV